MIDLKHLQRKLILSTILFCLAFGAIVYGFTAISYKPSNNSETQILKATRLDNGYFNIYLHDGELYKDSLNENELDYFIGEIVFDGKE